MDKKYSKLFKGTCTTCKNNNWLCGNNPLHVMFKYLHHTEEGRRLASYLHSRDTTYTQAQAYGWLYDGVNGTNTQNVNYETKKTYYEGIVYSLGKHISKLQK